MTAKKRSYADQWKDNDLLFIVDIRCISLVNLLTRSDACTAGTSSLNFIVVDWHFHQTAQTRSENKFDVEIIVCLLVNYFPHMRNYIPLSSSLERH